MEVKYINNKSKILKTFSRVSSMASSLSFSLPPFFRMLSQKVASSSALELPATPLLQKTSKASLRACGRGKQDEIIYRSQQRWVHFSSHFHMQTLWKSVWFWKQSFTYARYLSCSSMTFLTKTWRSSHVSLCLKQAVSSKYNTLQKRDQRVTCSCKPTTSFFSACGQNNQHSTKSIVRIVTRALTTTRHIMTERMKPQKKAKRVN